MKKKRLCAALALLLGLTLAAGCAGAPASSSEAPLREEDARIPGEGSGFVVQLEGEPPVSQQVRENTVTPGFIHMTEEYLRAREVFRLFRGNPSHVEDFPREDGTWYQPGTLSQEIDGKLYYRAWNRYENWADFEAMVRAVFTDEYADALLAEGTFRNRDGVLWYAADTAQPDPAYQGGRTDNFLTVDRYVGYSEVENSFKEFTLLAHYEGENGVFVRELPLRAEYTEETGWRFDRFDDPAYTDRTYPPQQRQEYTDLSFLTEEQQALFTAARQAADDYLFGSASNILRLPGNRMGETFSVQQNGYTVEAAVVEGADGDYAALTRKMRGLFTGEYLEKSRFTQRFGVKDGRTTVILGDMGTDIYYTDGAFDTYRLIGAREDAVDFMLVAHYASPQDYETDDSFIYRRDTGNWDYLVEYPVRLVNTPEGWRLDTYERPY